METNRTIIDFAPDKKCYAPLWSYDEICVHCRCCNKNPEIRRKARLKYLKWWLNENLNFSNWADDYPALRKIQGKNVAHNIKRARRRIRYYLKTKKGGK
jgi:hypothetical protein